MRRRLTSELSDGVVGLFGWNEALRLWRRGAIDSLTDDVRIELDAAGMIDADGQMMPGWAEVLNVAAFATSGAVVVARRAELVVLSTLYVKPPEALVVRGRARATNERIDAVEPVAHLTHAPAAQMWEALRPGLPEIELFTSAGEPGEPQRVDADGAEPSEHTVEGLERFAASAEAPPELADALTASLEPEASVTLVWNSPERDSAETLAWYCHGGALYRIERYQLWRVGAGDVAAQLRRRVGAQREG